MIELLKEKETKIDVLQQINASIDDEELLRCWECYINVLQNKVTSDEASQIMSPVKCKNALLVSKMKSNLQEKFRIRGQNVSWKVFTYKNKDSDNSDDSDDSDDSSMEVSETISKMNRMQFKTIRTSFAKNFAENMYNDENRIINLLQNSTKIPITIQILLNKYKNDNIDKYNILNDAITNINDKSTIQSIIETICDKYDCCSAENTEESLIIAIDQAYTKEYCQNTYVTLNICIVLYFVVLH